MNYNYGMVTSSVVNDLVSNAQYVIFVVIFCPLKVDGQILIKKLLTAFLVITTIKCKQLIMIDLRFEREVVSG